MSSRQSRVSRVTDDRETAIRRLRRDRTRSRFVRWSVVLLLVLVVHGWMLGGVDMSDVLSPQRWQNVERFLGELRPFPLQGRAWDWSVAGRWTLELLRGKVWSAAVTTLAISVLAIVLATVGALLLVLPAARTIADAEPYLPGPRPPGLIRRLGSSGVVAGTRALLMFLRSVPEYVWAFLLVAMLGPTAWPAVLALAIHNAGVLGKLGADVVENLDTPALEGLRGVGGSRLQIAGAGILPAIVPRILLFVFYRWETCIREATVLGMLGIVSLGYWIEDARSRNHYDEMFVLILVGALIVLLGDVLSEVARRVMRAQR